VSEPTIDLALVLSMLSAKVCEFGSGGDMRLVSSGWKRQLGVGRKTLEGRVESVVVGGETSRDDHRG
jgi:hypothetical protein